MVPGLVQAPVSTQAACKEVLPCACSSTAGTLTGLMPGGMTKPINWSTATLYGFAVTCFSTVAFLPSPGGVAEESMAHQSFPE